MRPVYLKTYSDGRLAVVIEKTFKLLESCSICPRQCAVNRIKGELGFCGAGLLPQVYSFMPHYGEEPPISGEYGSGTIFFSRCNMHCLYCQNFEFSQFNSGREVSFEELSGMMLELQERGCHNINLVTPTHVMPQILKALSLAIPKSLKIPLVYNTGGYDLAQVIGLLDGIVDIYLPDMRYSDANRGLEYSLALDYPLYNQPAVKEMQRQVGIAKINNSCIMERGMIIRHLVFPNNIAGTEKTMRFISEEISPDTYISLMSQYFPCYKADEIQELNRRASYEEYESARQVMRKYSLHNGWLQEGGGLDRFAGTNIKPNVI